MTVRANLLAFILLIVSMMAVPSVVFADCQDQGGNNVDGANLDSNDVVTCTDTGGDQNATVGDGNQTGVQITIEETGVITTPSDGVNINSGNVTNNGTIDFNGGDGVDIEGDGTVTNNGTIDVNFGDGVDIEGDGTVTNEGFIGFNAANGVDIDGDGTVTNNGTIDENFDDGVDIQGNGTVTNNGIIDFNDGNGVLIEGDGTVINDGSIDDNFDDGIDIIGRGNVTNNGQINNNFSSNGVDVEGGGTVTNNGQVNGNSSDGIDVEGSAAVTNNGEVNNNGSEGVDIEQGSLVNNGQINGNNGGGLQVEFDGNLNDSFANNEGAEVVGTDGTVAIDMMGGNDQVTLHVKSTVVGTVDGGADFDTLTFQYESTSEDELADFAALIASLNPAGGTLSFGGRTFTWVNFEDLQALLTLIILEPVDGPPSGQECSAINLRTFLTPDGFRQVYSGFELFPNGFLVAVYKRSDVMAGDSYALSDPSTPAWSVYLNPDGTLNVFNETGGIVGFGCEW